MTNEKLKQLAMDVLYYYFICFRKHPSLNENEVKGYCDLQSYCADMLHTIPFTIKDINNRDFMVESLKEAIESMIDFIDSSGIKVCNVMSFRVRLGAMEKELGDIDYE